MEVVDSHGIYYTISLALKYVGCFLLQYMDLLRLVSGPKKLCCFLFEWIYCSCSGSTDPLIVDFLVEFTTCFLKEGLMKLNLMVPLIHTLPITSVFNQ